MCLVGLPATGKTTYIAALWAYLTSGLPDGGYRVTDFPDDPSYLNAIAVAWAGGADMPRNSLGATDRIEFTIETPSRSALTIVLPDLPGEIFLNAVVRPSIDEDPADAVTSSDLLLVFVNGEKARTYAALGDHQLPHGAEAEVTPAPTEGSEPGDASTTIGERDDQVGPSAAHSNDFAVEALDSDTLNTELLQRLVYLMRDNGTPPIVIVVSAWDALDGIGETPQGWLCREQPMLSQLIEELSRTTEIGVVGVSAQGANYFDDPTIVQKPTTERPWGCDTDGNRTDIAGPLLWFDGLTQDIVND